MEDCPDGELTKDQFIEMYNKIFPGGRADRFSEIIFRTFDADRRNALFKKNYYVVRNAGCARSIYTLKLSRNFLKSMNELMNRVYLERLSCR